MECGEMPYVCGVMRKKDGFSPRMVLRKKYTEVAQTVDVETGEVSEGFSYERTVDASRYVKVYDTETLMGLGLDGFRVLLYVMRKMTYGSQFDFVMKEAVEYTGMGKTAVYKGLAELSGLQIVRKVRNGVYLVNANVMYRGKRELFRTHSRRIKAEKVDDVVNPSSVQDFQALHRRNP